jgi:uncharacterized damage-inducible protein DinB
MNRLAHHFATMAYNNAWANHRLLGAVSQLSQADFVATRTSFFPTLKATLNHNLIVDWFYVDALDRGLRALPVNPDARKFFDVREPCERAAGLQAAQRASDHKLVTLCRALTDDDLDRKIAVSRRTGVIPESATRLLAHLFQHQIHHRGQAHAMLAGTSIAPPQLDDFFCADDAPLRAADLAELDYSEALIWA